MRIRTEKKRNMLVLNLVRKSRAGSALGSTVREYTVGREA